MRTVTNYFIVNLAVADFLVILICLPPTVLWDVTETWFMGTLACKIVLYFQVSAVIIIIIIIIIIALAKLCIVFRFIFFLMLTYKNTLKFNN